MDRKIFKIHLLFHLLAVAVLIWGAQRSVGLLAHTLFSFILFMQNAVCIRWSHLHPVHRILTAYGSQPHVPRSNLSSSFSFAFSRSQITIGSKILAGAADRIFICSFARTFVVRSACLLRHLFIFANNMPHFGGRINMEAANVHFPASPSRTLRSENGNAKAFFYFYCSGPINRSLLYGCWADGRSTVAAHSHMDTGVSRKCEPDAFKVAPIWFMIVYSRVFSETMTPWNGHRRAAPQMKRKNVSVLISCAGCSTATVKRSIKPRDSALLFNQNVVGTLDSASLSNQLPFIYLDRISVVSLG